MTSNALINKTAIITGASSGLGEQFARCLSNEGARVILAARRIEKLQALSADIPNSLAIELDVSNKNSVSACIKKLEESGEKIDICVNSAGIAARTPIFDTIDDDTFESIIKTNLMGVWYVTKAVANHMKNHAIQGSIINIASVNGDGFPFSEVTAYGISKAGVIHMAKTLMKELAQYKIRINTISPGLFQTPMTEPRLKTEEDKIKYSAKIPLGFVAQPKDLNGALLLLASNNLSAYMTGTCLTVDGGKSIGCSW